MREDLSKYHYARSRPAGAKGRGLVRQLRPRGAASIEVEPDHVLAQRAAEGDSRAFEELYRRHAPAAWRVAYAVAGNPDDAADAVSDAFTRVFQALPAGRLTLNEQFRPYLLAATRNAALDGLRRLGRTQPSATPEDFERPSGDLASELAVNAVDSSLVAVAFRSLPERWRSVLWLTEVEGIPAREAAPMLGISANGLAQLAVRARAGLRQRFLQAHLRKPIARACQFPVEKLGAYVAGGLSPRDTAKVDQHLAGCTDCQQQVEELEDLGSLLRRVIIPVPLALGAVSISKWKLATASSTHASGPSSILGARKPLAMVAAAMFALGVITTAVVQRPDVQDDDVAQPSLASPRTRPPTDLDNIPSGDREFVSPAVSLSDGASSQAAGLVGNLIVGGASGDGAGASGPDDGSGGGGRGGGTPPPPVPRVEPPPPPPSDPPVVEAALVANLGDAPVDVSLGVGGDGCSGLQLGTVIVGCDPPPEDNTVALRTRGSLLGDNVIGLG